MFKKGHSGNPRGRTRGVPNKTTTVVKDMVLLALAGAGGVAYLTTQAKKNPRAFLQLVGRVIPVQVTGKDDAPLVPASVVFVLQKAPNADCRD